MLGSARLFMEPGPYVRILFIAFHHGLLRVHRANRAYYFAPCVLSTAAGYVIKTKLIEALIHIMHT